MTQLPRIERFKSDTGVRIYRIPCEAFPNFIVYVYVLFGAGPPTLIDCGSGYGQCPEQLHQGLETLKSEFGEPFQPSDLGRIILTHGHIDHFGGLAKVREFAPAPVGIHVLDRRILSAYEERVVVATKALAVYLERAGVPAADQEMLMKMYGFSKKHVHSVNVDFLIEDGLELDGMTFLHTPGHCPGQVCIVIGDILISADHILERISPHQAPESITPYTGLGHYLESLRRVEKLRSFKVALGGHEGPIHDVHKRIEQLNQSHQRKLTTVLDELSGGVDPATINDLTDVMYPRAKDFHRLLALEEVGAHVEYLYQRGDLAVVNLDEVETQTNPALRYRPI